MPTFTLRLERATEAEKRLRAEHAEERTARLALELEVRNLRRQLVEARKGKGA